MALLTLLEELLNRYFAAIPRKKPKIEDTKEVQLIAHRGAHNNQLGLFENTMEAFKLAKKAGCWGIELDVHVSADNVLVVNHDPTLNRLWQQDVVINEVTFSKIRSLAPQVPSLAEVIAEFGGQMHLFIELKTLLHDDAILVEALQHLSPARDYHVLALSPDIFKPLTQFPKKSLLLVPVHNNVKSFCELSIKSNYGGVMGSYLLLTNKRMQQLHEAHQALGVGFVNSKNSLWREINRGVKWIFTNQAVVVSHYLHLLKH